MAHLRAAGVLDQQKLGYRDNLVRFRVCRRLACPAASCLCPSAPVSPSPAPLPAVPLCLCFSVPVPPPRFAACLPVPLCLSPCVFLRLLLSAFGWPGCAAVSRGLVSRAPDVPKVLKGHLSRHEGGFEAS